jgi:signal transduction histidine kinase
VTWPRPAAYAGTALTLAMLVVGWVLCLRYGTTADLGWQVGATALAALPVVTGLLVAHHRPANPIGFLLVLVGASLASLSFSDGLMVAHEQDPGAVPDAVIALGNGSWVWVYVPLALLVLLFPDGHLLSPRWRVVLWGIGVLFPPLAAMDPRPFAPPYEDVGRPFGTLPTTPLVDSVGIVLLAGLIAMLVACAVSMRLRYRRAGGVERRQLKWLSLAALTIPGTLLVCWAEYLLVGEAGIGVTAGLVAMAVSIPLAAAVAMLKHDLYDVDRAVSATVTYAVVTAGLLGVFVATSFLVGLRLGQDSAAVAAATTALVAVALSPLRLRLQRLVDRWLYPRRQAALAAIDDLRRRVHAGKAEPEQLEAVLRRTLKDPGLLVGYVVPGTDEPVGADGAPTATDGAHVVPVELGGTSVGVLVTRDADLRDLLRELAPACTLLVEVVRLRVELAGALRDVESSRARLLKIGYEERRRLERDLHDGAQQRLVSLGMVIRVAQRHLADGTVDTYGLLDQTVAEIATAVGELRQIAHGLRPSTLDDGLGHALRSLASSSPVPLALDVTSEPLPDDVTSTVYYVASEAVANAVKHAQARQIGLRVARSNGDVRVVISDDGVGGASPVKGSGLAGLGDRVAAAGGSLLVDSAPGRGTQIEAVLPCAS